MSAIYRKEMKIYLSTPFGYAVMAVLLFFMGVFTVFFHFLSGTADFSYPLVAMEWVLLVTVPLLTMRSIAEERHSQTDQLLYSLPLRLREIVLGKYLAMLTVFLLPTAVAALYPLLLSAFGKLSLAAAYTALFGYILLGASLIAVCSFVSSLVENQILAAVLSIAVSLCFYLLDDFSSLLPTGALGSFLLCIVAALLCGVFLWRSSKSLNLGLLTALVLVLPLSVLYVVKASLFEELAPRFANVIALFGRFEAFAYGHFNIPATVLYLTVIAFFLFLTVRSMEKRRIS
ncbi:MAG: ABC transporter permease [Clostridia bacterium]|nr:ABC transporter permease [Clostridia bacterium]